MILMRKEAENVGWLMCASRGRRKSALKRFCFAENAPTGDAAGNKSPIAEALAEPRTTSHENDNPASSIARERISPICLNLS